jgi:hypothetical protein
MMTKKQITKFKGILRKYYASKDCQSMINKMTDEECENELSFLQKRDAEGRLDDIGEAILCESEVKLQLPR